MSKNQKRAPWLNRLTLTTALAAAGAGLIAPAAADTVRPEGVWDEPAIVPNNNLNRNLPPPAGILDSGIIGVGQMISDVPPPGGGIGLCTGSLINPRTVLFAAHCVNNRPASDYGSANGGVGLSFGFNADNRPAAINWISNNFASNPSLAIFNANQLWYDPRSLALGPTLNFLQADVAIATLDTRADDIPTWTILFSPLSGPTHVTIVGYGATGNGTQGANAGIDFRRRIAENILDSHFSLLERNLFLFGSAGNPPLPQTLYSLDFDDPARGTPAASPFDFDLFDGPALPNEGTTAGGDSGGPLIVDQAFNKPVVAGVLSGGSRFFGPQPFSSYGTQSFFQPLYLFWDVIVQNNPYVYASAKEGNRDWFDPTHWVQDMDPNYAVIRNGALANDLPDTAALGVTGETARFGSVCFLDDCLDLTRTGPGLNSAGPGLILAGGPGSVNFVPNNVEPDRLTGVKARYYEVTLSQKGRTRLRRGEAATIDKLNIAGSRAELRIDRDASLRVIGDLTVTAGEIDLRGRLETGEAVFLSGLLRGDGVFDPTVFTSVAGAVAPGGFGDTATLTIQGDVVLASGSLFAVDLGRRTSDLLRVTADAADATTGIINLGGTLFLATGDDDDDDDGPRHGQTIQIIVADGAATATFNQVVSRLGNLRPTVTYGANVVSVSLQAGDFDDLFDDDDDDRGDDDDDARSFALALDAMRATSYNQLSDLYGAIDLLEREDLVRSLSAMVPAGVLDARGLMAMHADGALDGMSARLGDLSRGVQQGSLTVMGAPGSVFAAGGDEGLDRASALQTRDGDTRSVAGVLPEGVSMFLSGGYDQTRASPVSGLSSADDEGLRAWRMAGGVERTMDDTTVGVAAVYTRGAARRELTAGLAETTYAQAAIYGVHRMDDGAYVMGLVGSGAVRADAERRFAAGSIGERLGATVDGDVVQALVEVGRRFEAKSTGFTPKASIQRTTITVAAFEEQGGSAALGFDAADLELAEARLGVSFDGAYALKGWLIEPDLSVMGVANLSDDQGGVWTRFAAAPDHRFLIPGEARDDAWAEVTGGLSLVRGDLRLGLSAEQNIGREETHENRFVVDAAFRF